MAKEIGTVEQALQDLKEGKVILVIDDPDRENEGDLICVKTFAAKEKTGDAFAYTHVSASFASLRHDDIVSFGEPI